MSSRSYRDLVAWQKAMNLVADCYRFTDEFPKSEIYGLTNQLRRTAVSVPANIAEGQGRQSEAEFVRFLYIAYGSLSELETHIEIAQRLNFVEKDIANNLLEQAAEVGRVLNGLISYQETKKQSRPTK